MTSASMHSRVTMAAIASVSALCVTLAGISGFRSGHGRVDELEIQVRGQQATIALLTADLERVRAERDKLAADLRERPSQANRPKLPKSRPDVEPFDFGR